MVAVSRNFFVLSRDKKKMEKLDKAYLAIVRYQRREFEECIEVCTKILEQNPYDEAIWSLKTRALTAQVFQQCFILKKYDMKLQ